MGRALRDGVADPKMDAEGTGGRVVYGSGLENRQPERVRGFESHSVRQYVLATY